MTLTHTDFAVQTGGIPFVFSRTYNNRYNAWKEGNHSVAGFGWRHSYQSSIELPRIVQYVPGLNTHRVWIGASVFAFKETSGVYVPQRGSGGYKLEKVGTEWVMTAPTGMVYRIDETTKRLTKQVAPSGAYLEFTYTSSLNTLNHYRLASIKAFLKGGVALPKALYFEYVAVATYYRLRKVVLGEYQQASTCDPGTCNANGGICINTLPGISGMDSIESCGKTLLELEYNTDQMPLPPGATEQPIFGTSSLYLCIPQTGGDCKYSTPIALILDRAYRGAKGQTSDFIYYIYSTNIANIDPQNNPLPSPGYPDMTSVMDGTGKILETHTYDANRRALTSNGPDGNLTFAYTSNNTTTITKPNGQTKVKVFDTNISRVTSQSGSCNCSLEGEQFSWMPPNNTNGYILPSSTKIRDTSPVTYQTYDYGFHNSRMAWKTVTYGDQDSAGYNPATGNEYKVKTTYHRDYPGLPTSIVSDSANTGQQREIIFDYDDPSGTSYCATPSTCTNCEAGQTCTGSQFNQSPTAQVHRIITRGYTRDINGSWQLSTRVIKYTYESTGRLLQITGPGANQRPSSSPSPGTSQVTDYIYYGGAESNSNNNRQLKEIKVTVIDPRTSTSTTLSTIFNAYNEYGQPTQVTDPNGVYNQLVYDTANGRLKEIHRDMRRKAADGNDWAIWKFTRDAMGRVTMLEQPNGGRLHYSYETYGRLEMVSYQDGPSGTIKGLQKYIYNTSGQLIETQRLQAKDSSSQILKLERIYSFLNGGPSNNKMQIELRPPLPGQGSRFYVLNQNNTMAEITDENGHKTLYSYHSTRRWLEKITRYTDAANTNAVEVNMAYDKAGRMTSMTDAKGVATSYVYDDFNQVVEITSPDRAPAGTPIRFEYDQSGNLIRKKRPDGTEVAYLYDSLNRLIRVDYPSPSSGANLALTDNDVEYYYGESSHTDFAKGRLTRVTVKMLRLSLFQTLTRTTRYVYDAAGRAIEEQVDNGGTVYTTKYEYDKEGHRKDIHYPYSTWRHYRSSYNTAGQLTSVALITNPTDSILRFQADYLDAAGNTEAGGVLSRATHQFKYIPGPAITEKLYTTGLNAGAVAGVGSGGNLHKSWLASGPAVDGSLVGHTGILSREFTHNKTGLIDEVTCLGSTSAGCYPGNTHKKFLYDGLYRLSAAGELVNSAPRYAFTYDANGNLTKNTDNTLNGDEWNLEYASGSNRLQKRYLTGSTQSQPNYLQQSDGKRSEDPYWTYTYHTNGRLAVMTPKAGNNKGTIVYGYDHMGRRVYKIAYDPQSSNSTTSLFFFDLGGQLLEQYDQPSNNIYAYRQQFWLWAGGTMVGGGVLAQESLGVYEQQTYNYHLDHLGRPVAITSVDNIPVWRSKSLPYGRDPGYALKDNPYQEVDIQGSPIQKLNYAQYENHSQNSAIMTSGTFGVQFYFETLKLETGYDQLSISSLSTSGSELLQSFTGDHQTGAWGNPGTGFWGPVMHVRPKEISNTSLGQILFQLQDAGYSQLQGYKITSYRLWHVPEGNRRTSYASDSPATGTKNYDDGLGQGSTPPWQRNYTKAGAHMSRVCFNSFNVEFYYDRVEIRDKDNHIIQVLTGTHTGCSAWVQGDTVRVLLFSDGSLQGGGFTVGTVEHMVSPESKARFPGQWYDKDTEVTDSGGNVLYAGLSYNWHRFYDAEVGRYITPDPIGLAGGMNVYSYAGNDPKNAIDFDGFRPGPTYRQYGPTSVDNTASQYALREALNQHGRKLVAAGATTAASTTISSDTDTPTAPAPDPGQDCPKTDKTDPTPPLSPQQYYYHYTHVPFTGPKVWRNIWVTDRPDLGQYGIAAVMALTPHKAKNLQQAAMHGPYLHIYALPAKYFTTKRQMTHPGAKMIPVDPLWEWTNPVHVVPMSEVHGPFPANSPGSNLPLP